MDMTDMLLTTLAADMLTKSHTKLQTAYIGNSQREVNLVIAVAQIVENKLSSAHFFFS